MCLLLPLVLVIVAPAPAQQGSEVREWVQLFNGKNLEGRATGNLRTPGTQVYYQGSLFRHTA